MIRVAVVDDQKLIRAGLRMILATEHDIDVVAEADDGDTAVAVCRETAPDVVLMDIRMPRMNGIDATRALMAGDDPPRVLVLTTFHLDEYVYDALRAGASGFLLKDGPEEQLVAAIRTVHQGVSLLAPEVTQRLVERFAPARANLHERQLDLLTPREVDVLRALTEGSSNAEIAAKLYLSQATVKTHVNHLLSKLGLASRTQAVVFGYESGLVTPGSRA